MPPVGRNACSLVGVWVFWTQRVSALRRRSDAGRLSVNPEHPVFPADAVLRVEPEGQTLGLLSPSLTTTVGRHSTNSIQNFFQRCEEATVTADDVGKTLLAFPSLHSSPPSAQGFYEVAPSVRPLRSTSNQRGCSPVRAVTLL